MPEKENITLFFCDLRGTIDGELTEGDTEKFAELLDELREKNDSSKLFFSMASTERIDIVEEYQKKLSKYFKKNVEAINAITNSSKLDGMEDLIEKLNEKYNINAAYYADDNEMIREMCCEVLQGKYNIEFNPIEPDSRLSFINDELESKYINSFLK